MIAQLPDPNSYMAMGWVIAVLLALGGGYLLILNIQVQRKKLATPPATGAQPQPFIVQEAEVFVKTPDFDKTVAEIQEEISAVEGRIETLFRDRFHKIDEAVNSVSLNARNLGEQATHEFKNIEGRLGEMKASLQHITAQNSNTNQKLDRTIEALPEAIAKAIDRSRPRRP